MKRAPLRSSSLIVLLVLFAGCASSRPAGTSSTAPQPLAYVVNLTDLSGDTFKVTLQVDDLTEENAVYQFAATAPGTYQVMDIGRFVRSFEAVDSGGELIASEQISTNQWRISDPEEVVQIRYELAETWDTPVEENMIYRMAGTSLEADHALFNNQAVFGYPTGMQARPVRILLQKPTNWTVGTALATDDDGYLIAENYDHLVDSPILAGELTSASLDVRGADVDIYTYSVTGEVESAEILHAVESILEAAGTYLGELPVDRYAFLFHFDDITMGALEHSYSSTYVIAEQAFDQLIVELIPDIVAHEFLHIVTPLNIHSEVIEQFNFVSPTPSEHVWLYEGITEWMAHTSQLRGGQISVEEYLERLSEKLALNDHFDPQFSLSDIGLQSYSEKGQQEWGNIYQRGAVVGALLDITLLDLSDGERGLREVILDLSEEYGPDEAFDEKGFVDEFVARTYPEIGPFFAKYVRGTEPLPLEETFAKVGVNYLPDAPSGEQEVSLGVQIGVSGGQLILSAASGAAAECGFAAGDHIVGLNGEEVTLSNAQQTLGQLQTLGAGEPFVMTVRRGDDEHAIECARVMKERVDPHALRIDPNASDEQVALRRAWTEQL